MSVKPIPSDYPRLTPMAALAGCAKAVEFYKEIFGATERMRFSMPDGSIAHIELAFGDSVLMLGEAMPEHGVPPTTLRLSLYVENCDEVHRRAVAAGAREDQPPTDQFYGDRQGRVTDPWGIQWSIGSRIKEMTVDEMQAEMKKQFGG